MTALCFRPGVFPASVECHLNPARRHWRGVSGANSAAIMAKCGNGPRDSVQPLGVRRASVPATPVARIPWSIDSNPNPLGAGADGDRRVQKYCQDQCDYQRVDGHSVSPLLPLLPVARQLLNLSIVPSRAKRRAPFGTLEDLLLQTRWPRKWIAVDLPAIM